MHQCHDCQGFIPAKAAVCPNCQIQHKPSFSQRFKRVMQLVLGSSVTMTLAACYGTPPPMPQCDETGKDSQKPCRPNASASDYGYASPSPSSTTSPSSTASPSSQASTGT